MPTAGGTWWNRRARIALPMLAALLVVACGDKATEGAGTRTVVTAEIPSGNHSLEVIDGRSGILRWAVSDTNLRAASASVAIDDTLFAIADNCAGGDFAVAWDRASGAERWRVDLGGGAGPDQPSTELESFELGSVADTVAVPHANGVRGEAVWTKTWAEQNAQHSAGFLGDSTTGDALLSQIGTEGNVQGGGIALIDENGAVAWEVPPSATGSGDFTGIGSDGDDLFMMTDCGGS